MKQLKRTVAVALIALVAALWGVLPGNAYAATLYDGANYVGDIWSAASGYELGSVTDRTSSLKTFAISNIFYEDWHYNGRSFRTASNFNDLRFFNEGLSFNITWNDRISSFKR